MAIKHVGEFVGRHTLIAVLKEGKSNVDKKQVIAIMKLPSTAIILFWIVVIVAPAFACVISAVQFPPGVEIPLHWNSSGRIDRWGSPWMMLPASLIMCGANALLGLMYRYSDKLYDMGLVHGVSRKATRPVLCGTAVFLVIVMVAIFVGWTINAKAVLS